METYYLIFKKTVISVTLTGKFGTKCRVLFFTENWNFNVEAVTIWKLYQSLKMCFSFAGLVPEYNVYFNIKIAEPYSDFWLIVQNIEIR